MAPRNTKHDPAQDELALSSVMAHARFPGRSSLRVAEVADALEITPQHVIDLCEEGLIEGIDIAGKGNTSLRQHIRIPVSAYDAYIRSKRISNSIKEGTTP